MITSPAILSRTVRAAAFAGLIASTALSAPAIAQDDQAAQQEGQTTQTETEADSSTTTETSPAAAGAARDIVVATVNGVEIRQSDIQQAITTLPPQMQQLAPEMVVSMAVDQLVTGELLLEQARAENLQDDPQVRRLVEPMIEQLTEQAMIRVWLTRQFDQQLDDTRLQEEFAEFQQANPDSELTLEQARPQLEQAIRQQILDSLTADLRQDAEIIFYDASGDPLESESAAGGGDDASSNAPDGGKGNEAGDETESKSSE